MYQLVFKKSVLKDFRKLEKKDQQKILKKIKTLSHSARPIGSEKLTNREEYRIRVGNFRILYEIKNKQLIIIIVKIGHRKNIYT